MFPRAGIGSIAERREDGFALVPVGKLIGIVAAAGLAGFSRGNEQDGLIPITGVCHEAQRGTMSLSGRAHAVERSRLRLVGTAEEALQQALAADGMEHIQRVKALPSPICDAFTSALLG